MSDKLKKIAKYENIQIPKVNTIIGNDTIFRGNFVIEGPIRIDGSFEGDIKSMHTVIVGSSGKVKGDIFGDTVIIGGKVKGNIFGIKEIILLSTASVIGNLTSQKTIIDDGASFKGRLNRIKENEITNIFITKVKTYIDKQKASWVHDFF